MMCSKAVISLILPLCGLPILSADFTEESAIQYLQKFGHINSPIPPKQSCRQIAGRVVCESSLIKGETLRKYQAFTGLPQTGTLDEATKSLMKSPRCGQKDMESGKRKWKKKNLTYRVVKYSRKISRNAVDKICRKAMDMWEEAANIRFIHGTSRKVDIEILFGTREHGDDSWRPFDGPWTNKDDYKSLGAEIAHAFYPPRNTVNTGLAGDVHIDDDEDWSETFNIGLDLLHTVVHELGHSLGLEHSKGFKGTIMHPHHPGWVRHPLKLHANDIERIQGLYGKPAGNPRPQFFGSNRTPPPTQGPRTRPSFRRRPTPPSTQGPIPPPTQGSTQNCEYECSSSGGCQVYYVGRHRAGKTKGSCFPDSFGGSCNGTPPECHDCNRAITCSEGGNPRRSGGERKSSKGRQRKECEYECTSSGGCQVYYVGRPRSGKSKGSCFPDFFGGSCIGTPPECHDCNRAITCSEGGHPQRG